MQLINLSLFGKENITGLREGLMTLLKSKCPKGLEDYTKSAEQLVISAGVSASNPIEVVLDNPILERLEKLDRAIKSYAGDSAVFQYFINGDDLFITVNSTETMIALNSCKVDLTNFDVELVNDFIGQYVVTGDSVTEILHTFSDKEVLTYIENFGSIDHLLIEDVISLQQDFDLGLYRLYLENCSGCTYKEC